MTSSRFRSVDFTEQIFIDHWGLVCPLQEKADNMLFKPIENIWHLLLTTKWAFMIVMGLTDYIFFGFVNWDYACGFFHRTFFNQGVENLKNDQMYQKILITAWVLPIFFFVQVYLGTMTASLTSSSLYKPIRDVSHLVSQSELSWKLPIGSSMMAQLRESPPGTDFRRLHDGGNTTIDDCYSAYEAGEQYWTTGRSTVFLCTTNAFKALISADFSASAKCNYYKTKDEFHTMNLAMAFQVLILIDKYQVCRLKTCVG